MTPLISLIVILSLVLICGIASLAAARISGVNMADILVISEQEQRVLTTQSQSEIKKRGSQNKGDIITVPVIGPINLVNSVVDYRTKRGSVVNFYLAQRALADNRRNKKYGIELDHAEWVDLNRGLGVENHGLKVDYDITGDLPGLVGVSCLSPNKDTTNIAVGHRRSQKRRASQQRMTEKMFEEQNNPWRD